MKAYFLDRLKERDTKVVIAAAIYTVARAFIPPQYVFIADTVAGALGISVAATPLNKV